MVQLEADAFFALETGKEGRIGLKFHVGHLDRHNLIAVEAVLSLENRCHAAATEEISDQKPSIQQMPGLERRIAQIHRIALIRDAMTTGDLLQTRGVFSLHPEKVARVGWPR